MRSKASKATMTPRAGPTRTLSSTNSNLSRKTKAGLLEDFPSPTITKPAPVSETESAASVTSSSNIINGTILKTSPSTTTNVKRKSGTKRKASGGASTAKSKSMRLEDSSEQESLDSSDLTAQMFVHSTPTKSAKKRSNKLFSSALVTPPKTPENAEAKQTEINSGSDRIQSRKEKEDAITPDRSVDSGQSDGANSEADDPNEIGSSLSEDDDSEEYDDDMSTKKDDSPDDADQHLIDITGKDEVIRRFKCSFCGKTSRCRADLKKHIRVHTGVRPHKCKVCNASFIQITALRGHETIHTGQKPFACDVCDKKFAIKDRLRLHMRVHTGEKPYKCPQCNMTFARRSQIVQHAKIHSTERSYKCDECAQTFTTYHMLKAHQNTHRGIKEFMCVACGKKFMRLEGMNKHIRTVHRGSRPYTCNICGKSFKGHLQQHMRLHMGVRPFECPTCKATFTQNSQLTVHMRIHTGDRPYKCQICGANFAHSSACKIHMRSHTGEKPFKCVICKTSFAQLPHLKKHMRCVHDAEKPYLCTTCCGFFQTQQELDMHKQLLHGVKKTNEEEAEQTVEEATLAKLRARLAVLLYRISSEERRAKFGFGKRIIDDVLKTSLKSSGHEPITDPEMSTLNELRQNVLLLLKWTIPVETMEEYHRNSMTVDEVLEMLTS